VRLVKGGPQKVRPKKKPPPPVRRKTNKMKITTKFLIPLIIFVSITIWEKIEAIDITVTGDWFLTIDASDLQAGAGSNLNPTYFSATDQIRIDIENTNTSWAVSVRGVATNWHPNLRFGLRRTTNGIGPGSISGGTSWLEVTGIDQQFFTGSLLRSNVRVQCGLTGVSVQVAPDTYSGTIIYTVTEI
jgi:hypothetical protein